MRGVLFEMQLPDGQWVPMGLVPETEEMGSCTGMGDDGPELYLFGYRGDLAGVWLVHEGASWEPDPTHRVTWVESARLLADLSEGPYQRAIVHRVGTIELRWGLT